MKEQIHKIIEAEGLTPAKFADEIGVQRSSISHIISGRNKPSYDLIMKIIERFRGINAEWLLTGKGSMIKSSESEENAQKKLFNGRDNAEEKSSQAHKMSEIRDFKSDERPVKSMDTEIFKISDNLKEGAKGKYVTNVNREEFILIFFEDGTYKRYHRRD